MKASFHLTIGRETGRDIGQSRSRETIGGLPPTIRSLGVPEAGNSGAHADSRLAERQTEWTTLMLLRNRKAIYHLTRWRKFDREEGRMMHQTRPRKQSG